MQTSNANKYGSSNDPVWQFLAEYSLSEFVPSQDQGDRLAAESLYQAILELGIPLACFENIEKTLTRFAWEVLGQFKPGRLELPERIRVFCQKKMIAEKMNGGWGYFLIERTEGLCGSSSASSQHFVDLYIYREGK